MAALGGTVGSNRADAIWRIAFLAILILGGAVVLVVIWLIAVIAASIWFLVDVLWQLITNSEGWSSGRMSGVSGWLERLFYWPIDMLEWLAFGRGSFPWLP